MSDLLVPATVVTVVGLSEAKRIASGEMPTVKPVIGGFVLGLGLYALDGLDQRLGRTFCVLIIVGSLMVNGQVVFTKTNQFLGAKKAT